MQKKHTPAKLLDEYLESVQGINEAETDSFFYTRLSVRMQQPADWQFPLRPVWIIAGLVLLLVINGWMLFSRFKTGVQENALAKSSVQGFANAYDLTVRSNY